MMWKKCVWRHHEGSYRKVSGDPLRYRTVGRRHYSSCDYRFFFKHTLNKDFALSGTKTKQNNLFFTFWHLKRNSHLTTCPVKKHHHPNYVLFWSELLTIFYFIRVGPWWETEISTALRKDLLVSQMLFISCLMHHHLMV